MSPTCIFTSASSIRYLLSIVTELPGVSNLRIQAWDYDTLFSDELIGETVIDIEDRYFDHNWTNLDHKPIEIRPLYHEEEHGVQGYVSLWLEIFDKKDKKLQTKWNIERPPEKKIELRVIIWQTKSIPMLDDEGTSDIYVKTFLEPENSKETDVHIRCQTGNGSFNWRCLLPVTLPREEKGSELNIQVYDWDLWSGDDYICCGSLNLDQLMKIVYQVDIPMHVSRLK